jgi:hypothetical protein
MRGEIMPFSAGQSGNPKGRPRKNKSLTEALEKELRKRRQTGKTGKAELAKTLVDLAMGGDIAALKYVYDRIDGKPRETVVLENAALEIKLLEVLDHGN